MAPEVWYASFYEAVFGPTTVFVSGVNNTDTKWRGLYPNTTGNNNTAIGLFIVNGGRECGRRRPDGHLNTTGRSNTV